MVWRFHRLNVTWRQLIMSSKSWICLKIQELNRNVLRTCRLVYLICWAVLRNGEKVLLSCTFSFIFCVTKHYQRGIAGILPNSGATSLTTLLSIESCLVPFRSFSTVLFFAPLNLIAKFSVIFCAHPKARGKFSALHILRAIKFQLSPWMVEAVVIPNGSQALRMKFLGRGSFSD